MAVTTRAASLTTLTGTSASATEPAGTAQNDMLVAVAIAGAVISQPAGWTQMFKDTQGAVSWVVSYVPRGASAPNLGWTWAGSVYYELHLLALKPGAGLVVAFDSVSAAGAKGNSLHAPDPPATVAIKGTSLCVIGGVNFGISASWTAATPAGYVIRSVNTGAIDAVMADKSLAAAGSENAAAFAPTASGDWWDGFAMTFTDEVSGSSSGALSSVHPLVLGPLRQRVGPRSFPVIVPDAAPTVQADPVVATFAPQLPPLLFKPGRGFLLNAFLPRGAVTNLVDPIFVLPPMPQPLVFLLKGQNRIAYPKVQPLPTAPALYITGVTKDSTGAVLAGCTVQLFRTVGNVWIETVVSNGSGTYAFSPVGGGQQYFVVAYKAGSPDVAGTTVNTLVGT